MILDGFQSFFLYYVFGVIILVKIVRTLFRLIGSVL